MHIAAAIFTRQLLRAVRDASGAILRAAASSPRAACRQLSAHAAVLPRRPAPVEPST